MHFEIVRDERNELLNRRELKFVLTYEGATPSRRDILGKLCALYNIDNDLAVLDSLKTVFGKQELMGTVRIYDARDALEATEAGYLLKRGMPKAEGEE
jgi:small subunit ribosomal protein S24e